MGLHNAGFDEIVGIDIAPHPNYPFDFIQANATNPPVCLQDFDFIWASPPCQPFTCATKNNKKGYSRRRGNYNNLIPEIKTLLNSYRVPYCIENVPKAPIRSDLMLCGEMFGLRIIRHRKFEIAGFTANQPEHKIHHGYYYSISGDTPNKYERKKRAAMGLPQQPSREEWQEAMGMPWCKSKNNISEAVPPAYSEYIAKEFFRTREFFVLR